MSKLFYVFFILATIGILDAGYLTYEHYIHAIPPCSLHAFLADCGSVLTSKYATLFGIPIALFGVLYYLSLLITVTMIVLQPHKLLSIAVLTFATIGALTSLSFVLLQIFVLHAICVYCMTSDTISIILFGLIWYMHKASHFSPQPTE